MTDDIECFECVLAEFKKRLYQSFPDAVFHKTAVRLSEDWGEEAKDDIWKTGQPWKSCDQHKAA